jgi:hypothetical protein
LNEVLVLKGKLPNPKGKAIFALEQLQNIFDLNICAFGITPNAIIIQSNFLWYNAERQRTSSF